MLVCALCAMNICAQTEAGTGKESLISAQEEISEQETLTTLPPTAADAAAAPSAPVLEVKEEVKEEAKEVKKEDGQEVTEEVKEEVTEEVTEASPKDAFAQDFNPEGPWMICDIEAKGLKNIRKKTVTKNISAKEGRLYEKNAIQDDVSSLMALGNFNKVDMDMSVMAGFRKNKEDKQDSQSYQCHRLTVIAEELPIFDNISYKGRKALSKGTITGAMSLKVKDPFSEIKLESDMEKIKAAYSERGYTAAKVSYEISENKEESTVEVTLVLEEGNRARVKEVIVEGLDKVNQKKFLKQMSNRKGKVYKEQKKMEDIYKATVYARDLGFYDFAIDDYAPVFSEDNSEVTITIKVTEGHKAVFGDTSFNGNIVLDNKELDKYIFYKKGKLFNQQKFDTTVRDIQEAYANKGYLRAEVNPVKNLDEQTSRLNITFDITENNIVYIDHIDITGNETTKTYIFARELPIKEGQIFSYEKVRRGQQKIMNLGFVNDAQIDITPTNDISKVDVGYNIVEGRPGMFTAGVAMSSLDGLYGDVSVNHMNLFGRAQRLSLRAMFGSRILDYTVSWSTPWLGDHPTTLGVDIFDTRRYRSYMTTSSAYTEKRKGGRVHLGPRFNDDIYNLNFSYTFENVHIYDIDEQYQGLEDGLVEGTTNESTFGTSFAIDTRDNYWDPTSGARNSISFDLTGGPFLGDLDIYKVDLKSSFNQTLININKDYPIVLMVANRAGMVKPYGKTNDVPAYERVFLGGADTVRGYDTAGEIGPETGGEIYYVGNVELKFPLAREGRRTIAQLAAFFDIGNSWRNLDDVRFRTGQAEDEFKMGVGFGLRLVTPSLPIRLDWGYGLNHKTGEKKTQIYFSMANLF